MVKVTAIVELEGVHDVDEAAELIGIGVATLWRWIKAGKVAPVKVSGRTLIPTSEVDRLNDALKK